MMTLNELFDSRFLKVMTRKFTINICDGDEDIVWSGTIRNFWSERKTDEKLESVLDNTVIGVEIDVEDIYIILDKI